MQRITLQRGVSTAQGTFGRLLGFYTLELPWKDNQQGISCIPAGLYECRYTLSPRMKKYTFEVLQVRGRSGIRIHAANLASQLRGCIALGEKLGRINGVNSILLSAPAIRKFDTLMAGKPFTLEILDA
jgi:hypothetical protein